MLSSAMQRNDSTSTASSAFDGQDWLSPDSSSTPPSSVPSSPSIDNFKLPEPFVPASLKQPSRQGPPLPKYFPSVPITIAPETVDENDAQTPDNWVKRNPNLVRLTGKHPFNCEARLSELFASGFFTPPELFYVRNHGAVPKVEGETLDNWTIRIDGLVEQEISLSVADLKSLFQVVTLPVTLVCAGNRRKEQNVIRKGVGFNWGAAGLSTALFTGVYLADILRYVRPIRPQAKHVVFEGTDALPNGPYGTSQRLSWALNKKQGMLIAWAMNGLPLEPDHGFPVRLVVPGQIGGRSVKWLHRIEVSAQESQHHLHFWDNKLIPTEVLTEQARAEAHWWYDPKYIINDLNVNSAIAKPDHDEMLRVPDDGSMYTLKGYAYAGGGRRVTRVEISLDGGDSWKLSQVSYPEDLFRTTRYQDVIYGTIDLTESDTYFCWCFWEFPVAIAELARHDVIIVRAMDEGLCSQPRDMYWNVTGMMNNWWFRIAIHKSKEGEETILRFEHPTMAGAVPGGWMLRMQGAGQDPLKPSFTRTQDTPAPQNRDTEPKETEVIMTKPGIERKITMEEVIAHDKSTPWFIVNGEVYDGTGFLDEHPGGADSILISAGQDATEDFLAIHSPDGKAKLASYHIGTLQGSSKVDQRSEGVRDDRNIFLQQNTWNKAHLTSVTRASHDSFLFRFALQHLDQHLGLPIGQHVFVRLHRKGTGALVQRAYTPVSKTGQSGFVDFLVKIYYPTEQWPSGGKMTMGLLELVVGDYVEIKGPFGSFLWEGLGVGCWKGLKLKMNRVGLVCGGSGITPILQIIRAALIDAEKTDIHLWLLYANRSEDDILCREELESFRSERFSLHYTIAQAPPNWEYSIGNVTDEMMATHLPPPSDDALILACGPEPMLKFAIRPGLTRLGWDIAKSLVVF